MSESPPAASAPKPSSSSPDSLEDSGEELRELPLLDEGPELELLPPATTSTVADPSVRWAESERQLREAPPPDPDADHDDLFEHDDYVEVQHRLTHELFASVVAAVAAALVVDVVFLVLASPVGSLQGARGFLIIVAGHVTANGALGAAHAISRTATGSNRLVIKAVAWFLALLGPVLGVAVGVLIEILTTGAGGSLLANQTEVFRTMVKSGCIIVPIAFVGMARMIPWTWTASQIEWQGVRPLWHFIAAAIGSGLLLAPCLFVPPFLIAEPVAFGAVRTVIVEWIEGKAEHRERRS